jgi:hypothetical protein
LTDCTAYNPSSHTLAAEIIARHNDACPILDSSELELLHRFCADLLRKRQCCVTAKAQSAHGSLAGFAIARHGTETPALEEREIKMLRK